MIRKYFLGSSFARNVVTLVTGTALAQVINFLFTIVLTRIYTPAEFGMLSVFMSIVSVVLVFSSGKYDVALVVAKDEEDAPRLLGLSMWICFFLALFSALLVGAIYTFDLPFYSNQEVHSWFWFVPLSLILLTGGQVFWMWFVRKKSFKSLSWIRIAEALALGSFSLLFHELGAIGLLFATLISQFVSFSILGIAIARQEGMSKFSFTGKELVIAAKRFKEFPVVNIPQGFVDMFQVNAIPLLLSGMLGAAGPAVIGLYSQCMRVLGVPMRLIMMPVAHVFLSEASERFRSGGDLYALVKKTVLRSALVALPVPIVLIAAGPFLFAIVFGEEWREAGEYARILAPWMFLDLIRAPIVQVGSIVRKQQQVLYFSIVSSVLLLVAIFAGLHFFKSDPRMIFVIISASQSVMTLVLILLVLRISRTKAPGEIV